jgi:hypothetical protein
VWNDFVNHTEEEQTFFLQNKQYSDEAKKEDCEISSKPAQDGTDDWVDIELEDQRDSRFFCTVAVISF